MEYKVIKRVTRVVDEKVVDGLLFKDENGKIAYLDRDEKHCDIEIGESCLIYVVTSKERFDFIRFRVNGFNISDVINLMTTLDNRSMVNLHPSMVKFLNDVSNNDTGYKYSQNSTTLPNLLKILNFYDTVGVNSEQADWICSTVDVMQYIHNTYKIESEPIVDNSIVPLESHDDLTLRVKVLKQEFHNKEEFDKDLAQEIHGLERQLVNLENEYKIKFKELYNLLNTKSEFTCTYGVRKHTYSINALREDECDSICIYGTDENGFRRWIFNIENQLDLFYGLNDISKNIKIWER